MDSGKTNELIKLLYFYDIKEFKVQEIMKLEAELLTTVGLVLIVGASNYREL